MPNPEEFNILNTSQFKMIIHRMPNVTYWLQGVNLPTVTLEGGVLPTPNRDVPVAGHKVEFDPLTIRFILDENLFNYAEIYHWILESTQATNINDAVSDISLLFLSGQGNVTRTVKFHGAHPTVLGEFGVQSDETDVIQTLGSATFNYHYFEFEGDDITISLG